MNTSLRTLYFMILIISILLWAFVSGVYIWNKDLLGFVFIALTVLFGNSLAFFFMVLKNREDKS